MSSELFPFHERIVIDINPETGDYSADIQIVSLTNLIGALTDLLEKAKSGELLEVVEVIEPS